MKKIFFYFLLCFLMSSQLFSQKKVFGVIIDSTTKEPIPGASIYFENTSIGTTSELDGSFILKYNSKIKSSLIFSFVGYPIKKISLKEIDSSKKLIILLKSSGIILKEVVINTNDGWPRELKLREFKKHYLGDSDNGKSCEILNPDDLILMYNSKEKKLTAKANKPIIIKNNRLKYKIKVDQLFFEGKYLYVSKNNRKRTLKSAFYSGSNFYSSTIKGLDTITENLRLTTYQGSLNHFMRSLASLSFVHEGFGIYRTHKKRVINLSKKVKIELSLTGDTKVYLPQRKDHLIVKYKEEETVSHIKNYPYFFTVNSLGNFSDADKITFSGVFGKSRLGDTLPLDYLIEDKK